MGPVSKSALLTAFAGVVVIAHGAVKSLTGDSKAEAHLVQGIQLLALAGISQHTSRIVDTQASVRKTKN